MTERDDENEPGGAYNPDDFMQSFLDELGTDGRALRMDELAELAIKRPISKQDIDYLFQRYAFLDLANADASVIPDDSVPAKRIRATNGWVIDDRGNRITGGPGRMIYGPYTVSDDEEGGDGQGASGILPLGTLIQQAYDTTVEMVNMVRKRWPMIQILAGFYPMQRAAWLTASRMEVQINFEPNKDDQKILSIIENYGGGRGKGDLKPRARK